MNSSPARAEQKSSACSRATPHGSQQEQYCKAGRQADKAADQAKTLMMVWGGVAAVCLTECVGNFGGAWKYICPGAGLAAGAAELLLAKELRAASTHVTPPRKPGVSSWIKKEVLEFPSSNHRHVSLARGTWIASTAYDALVQRIAEIQRQQQSAIQSGNSAAIRQADQAMTKLEQEPGFSDTLNDYWNSSAVTEAQRGGQNPSTIDRAAAANANQETTPSTTQGEQTVPPNSSELAQTPDSPAPTGQDPKAAQAKPEGSGLDIASCIAAAAATLQTYMKYSDYQSFQDASKKNLRYAAELQSVTSEAAGGVVVDFQAPPRPSVSTGTCNAKPGTLACAVSADLSLPRLVTTPEFASRFAQVSGTGMASFLQMKEQFENPSEVIQAGAGKSLSPKISTGVGRILARVEQRAQPASTATRVPAGYTVPAPPPRAQPQNPGDAIKIETWTQGERIPSDAVLGTEEDISRGVAPDEAPTEPRTFPGLSPR